MQNKVDYLSSLDNYLEGYFPGHNNTHSYFVGLNYAVATVPKKLSHSGSTTLDSIQAFDLAEVQESHLGQINMVIVSSFCGPNGKVWGLDIAQADKVSIPELTKKLDIQVYDANTLVEKFKELTGTIDSPRFPFYPGSHVLCASKNIIKEGPSTIYSGVAMGVPKDRNNNAILFMEDTGEIHENSTEEMIKHKLCESVLEIGLKQKIVYESIYVGMKSVKVRENEFGCALVASPYFRLAKKAIHLI